MLPHITFFYCHTSVFNCLLSFESGELPHGIQRGCSLSFLLLCANFYHDSLSARRDWCQNRFSVSASDLMRRLTPCPLFWAFVGHNLGKPRGVHVTSFIRSEKKQIAYEQHGEQPSIMGLAIRALQLATGTCEVWRDAPIAQHFPRDVNLSVLSVHCILKFGNRLHNLRIPFMRHLIRQD